MNQVTVSTNMAIFEVIFCCVIYSCKLADTSSGYLYYKVAGTYTEPCIVITILLAIQNSLHDHQVHSYRIVCESTRHGTARRMDAMANLYRPCACQGMVWQKLEKGCYGFKFHNSL